MAQTVYSQGVMTRQRDAPRLCLRSAIERGGGSGQLKGEQLQYALRTKSTRKQEFTRGHGSP